MSSLEVVLKLRKRTEEQKLEIYIRALNNLNQFKQKLEQLKGFRELYIREMHEHSAGEISMRTLLSYKDFIVKIENIVKTQSAQLTELEAETGLRQGEYLKAVQERRVIEELLAKKKQEEARLEARREQLLSDELASSKHAARLIRERRS